MTLGGLVAEELFFGESGTGPPPTSAARLARRPDGRLLRHVRLADQLRRHRRGPDRVEEPGRTRARGHRRRPGSRRSSTRRRRVVAPLEEQRDVVVSLRDASIARDELVRGDPRDDRGRDRLSELSAGEPGPGIIRRMTQPADVVRSLFAHHLWATETLIDHLAGLPPSASTRRSRARTGRWWQRSRISSTPTGGTSSGSRTLPAPPRIGRASPPDAPGRGGGAPRAVAAAPRPPGRRAALGERSREAELPGHRRRRGPAAAPGDPSRERPPDADLLHARRARGAGTGARRLGVLGDGPSVRHG